MYSATQTEESSNYSEADSSEQIDIEMHDPGESNLCLIKQN